MGWRMEVRGDTYKIHVWADPNRTYKGAGVHVVKERVSDWQPTTSWSDMGKVIEEMQRQGWDLTLSSPRVEVDDSEWMALWQHSAKPISASRGRARADTAPLAVALAAKEALT